MFIFGWQWGAERLEPGSFQSFSDMALSFGVPVVHIITGEAEDLMGTLITANSGSRASAQITVAAISFSISGCDGLGGKWSIGVGLSRELDDLIVRVQRRGLGGGQWWRSNVFVWLAGLHPMGHRSS